jgi:hypothetical protein
MHRVSPCRPNRKSMQQNSPSIVPRRAPFTRPAQALPISPTSKTNLFARYDWDPFSRCETQLSPAKQLAPRAHENPKSKTPRRSGSKRFRPSRLQNDVQNSAHCQRLRPVFLHGLPTIQAIVDTSTNTADEKHREIQIQYHRFSPPSRAGTVFASPPQIAERTIRIKSATDPAAGRLPSEATGRDSPFFMPGPKNPAIGPVL